MEGIRKIEHKNRRIVLSKPILKNFYSICLISSQKHNTPEYSVLQVVSLVRNVGIDGRRKKGGTGRGRRVASIIATGNVRVVAVIDHVAEGLV